MATDRRANRAKRAKRAAASRAAGPRPIPRKALGFSMQALRLSEKARREVAQLLKQQRAGTITGDQLETGLEEVVDNLQRMLNHILASL